MASKIAWGIWWTFIRAHNSMKNCTLSGSFCSQNIMFKLEDFRLITLSWNWKILKGKLIRGLKNDISNLVNFHANSRNSEHLEVVGLPSSNTCKDLDEKLQKTMSHEIEAWCQVWRKDWLLLQKKNIRSLMNFHASTCKFENLHFDVLILSIAF